MTRHDLSPRPPGPPGRRTGEPAPPVPLTSLVESWVADHLITPEQADRMLARTDVVVRPPSGPSHPHQRASVVVEALAYLGGVIILVASVLVASLYWGEVGTSTRLVLLGGVTVALLAAGFAVPGPLGDVGVRLRSITWLLSTGAFAGVVGLLGADVLALSGDHVRLMVGAGVAVHSAGLWLVGRMLVQQVTMMVGAMLTAAALVDELGLGEALPGFAVWGVALTWLLLGRVGLLGPRRLVTAMGAAGMFVGALTTIPTYPGIALALGTAVAVVAAAVLLRDLLLLAVGALGTLLVLPSSVIELFPGDLAAPVTLLVVGALLVGAGLVVARRGRTGSAGPRGGHGLPG